MGKNRMEEWRGGLLVKTKTMAGLATSKNCTYVYSSYVYVLYVCVHVRVREDCTCNSSAWISPRAQILSLGVGMQFRSDFAGLFPEMTTKTNNQPMDIQYASLCRPRVKS